MMENPQLEIAVLQTKVDSLIEKPDIDQTDSNISVLGRYFLSKLEKIKKKNKEYISEVRGRGLFLGVDIIKDHDHLKPNKKLAKKIINDMRENGILEK